MVIEFLVLNTALLPALKGEDSLWAVEVEEAVLGRFTAVLASKTSVLQCLYSIGRQSRVVILREILPQYTYPVGSWQIRKTAGVRTVKRPSA